MKIGGKMFLDELHQSLTKEKPEEQKVLRALLRSSIQDPYDSQLYAFAQTLFEEQRKQLLA